MCVCVYLRGSEIVCVGVRRWYCVCEAYMGVIAESVRGAPARPLTRVWWWGLEQTEGQHKHT